MALNLTSIEAQVAIGMVTLGGWFGEINPILTGLGTLLGITWYLHQIADFWRKK